MPKTTLKPNTDPIADMLSRLRNALLAGQSEVNIPHSRSKEAILVQLKKHGFIVGYKTSKEPPTLIVQLQEPGTNSRLSHLQRLSRPGRRYFVKAAEIPRIRGGQGICLVSTSKGLMAGHEARRLGLGGELIASVW